MHKKLLNIVVIMVLLIGGTYLRFSNIGKYSFWTDEFFAVYAAKSYIDSNTFYVPYEGEHPHRKLIVYITSYMFKTFGESETSARVPFAIANLLFILIAYFIFRRIFNSRIAVIICFMFAFSPLFIEMSRECRSYTLHQLFYFLASIFFFYGFEYEKKVTLIKFPAILKKTENDNEINILLLLIAMILGYIAKTLQPLTYNLVFVISAYAVTMLFIRFFYKKHSNCSTAKYLIVLVAIFSGALFQYLFNYQHFEKMLKWSTGLPEWARYKDYGINYYRWYFADNFPALFYLYPLGIYLLIKSKMNKGLFLFYMFIIPFLMHSFIYKLKSDRYIFYVFPFFVIGSAIVIERIIVGLEKISEKYATYQKFIFAMLSVPIIIFAIQPWFSKAITVPTQNKFPDWFSFDEKFKSTIENATVITTRPREYLYYFKKKPDYCIVNEKTPNYRYGEDLIDNEKKLLEVMANNEKIVLIAYRTHMNYNSFFTDQMKTMVHENMSEIYGDYEKSFIVLKRAQNKKNNGVE